MALLDEVIGNPLERLSRAILAQLQVLTGTRASGTVTVRASGASVELPQNTYMVPVIGGQRRDEHAFKVAPNPATAEEHHQGGEWTVTSSGAAVDVVSNLGGGTELNLPVGTRMLLTPTPAGMLEEAVVATAFTGAAAGLVKHVRIFENLESANAQHDLFSAKVGNYPALVLVWESSDPVEGRTSGMRQGASRKSRVTSLYYERFVLYVVTTRAESDPVRRREGQVLLHACSRLLTDRFVNDDGETLSTAGAGTQILQRARLSRSPTSYIYALRLRVISSLTKVDVRTWSPWLATRVVVDAADAPPDHPDPLDVVDATDPMP